MGINAVVDELNRLYQFDIDKYIKECNDLKWMGYKIYRNDNGEHKVVEPPKKARPTPFNMNDIFGGVFGDIFGGGS